MQLITILLNAVAILTFLTGLAVLCGVTKRSRTQGIWFFFSTLGAAIWSVAIAVFLTLPESSANLAPTLVIGIIAGITLTDVAILGYTSWSSNSGKVTTTLFGIGGLAITCLLATNPSLFYDNITFGPDFNQLHVVHGWYFYLLIVYFFTISLTYSAALSRSIKRLKSPGVKNGLKIFRAALSIDGILALIFDLILITSNPDLVWIGPMAVSVSIVSFYYSVVKYRILALSGRWMRVLSYVVLIAMGVVGYVLIFYLVFTAIFHIPNPSFSILLLNFVMATVLLCLIPALIEVVSMIRSLLPSQQLDIGYITRKLSKLRTSDADYKELASFLALTLRREYVALEINGKVYESAPNSHNHFEISQTSDLKDNKGKACGRILLGHPVSHAISDRWNTIQTDMVINLVGITIAKSN